MKKTTTFILIALAFILNSCAVNPITGRSTLVFYSNNELLEQSFADYKHKLQISNVLGAHQEESKLVNGVAERIIAATEAYYKEVDKSNKLRNFQWEVVVIESTEQNAWCMPGGKIAFFTGILPICEDENGVAAVMAHEIAHAIAGHAAQQKTNSLLIDSILEGLLEGGNTLDNQKDKMLFDIFYPISEVAGGLQRLKYSRKTELDADATGLILMALAGYDPRNAIQLWERMIKYEKNAGIAKQPQYLSTHPSHENRIKELNKLLPKAMKIYNIWLEEYNRILKSNQY